MTVPTQVSDRLLAYGDAYAHLGSLFKAGCRIGLSGPSGVGKTTFARLLNRGTGGTIHREVAREWLIENRVSAYWEMSPADVAEMQMYVLNDYESSSSNIYDRTPVDAVFFAQRAGQNLDQSEFEARAMRFAHTLDLIVFFPYRSEYLRDDGFRLPDPVYQLQCGGFILNKLIEHGLGDRTLIFQHHLSPEQSIEEIVRALADGPSSLKAEPDITT